MKKFGYQFCLAAVVLIFAMFFSASVFAREPWAPYWGMSIVNQSETSQWFKFSGSAVKAFSLFQAYEQETQIYNTDFADYADSWWSNLPSAYCDTQACDHWPYANGTVDNFTVGTINVQNLKKETVYSTYMKLKAGSCNSTYTYIKGQKCLGGLKLPYGGTKWTPFVALGTDTLTYFNVPVSNGKFWQH